MKRFADRFVLEREIGAGGMSRVFLGRDEVLDRPVAIKVLKPGYGETDIGARFRREGKTAARLSHPNIVQVYDAGEDELDGREVSYIVMEYLPGGDLKELIDMQGTLSGGELAGLSGVAAGLAHAHGRGVIHRDIKPHNVLLDETGQPKLADFGIARALDASHATRTGSYLGTALYSAPEQLQGAKVTPKSDVYSLGVMLYHAATGQPPFLGAPIEVANQHISKAPVPPREVNDEVSASLERLILDCLQKDPDARPTADEVRLGLLEAGRGAHATRAYAEPPGSAETRQAAPGTPPGRAAKSSAVAAPEDRRGPKRGLLAALAVLALIAVVGAFAVPSLLGGDNGGGQERAQGGGAVEEQGSGGGNDGGRAPEQQSGTQSGSGGGNGSQDGLTARAAEQTIRDHYEVAASDDYEEAWNFLSSQYQDQLGSRERWTDQFQTLESVEFTEGPTAQVDGETATVSFSTRAEHTNRVDTPSLTATLVSEDGEWRIDGLG
ncbi:MAG TPA: serine/threonine-protein kinase [Rubrobacteraceae bacterium]|nr:serine/threonine-protein kinase [Rubrobacteraceae bacterium]